MTIGDHWNKDTDIVSKVTYTLRSYIKIVYIKIVYIKIVYIDH